MVLANKYPTKIDMPLNKEIKQNQIFSNLIGLIGFYGISTIVGYLMSNNVYTGNMVCKHILLITFLNELALHFLLAAKWFQVLLCITNNSIKHQ